MANGGRAMRPPPRGMRVIRQWVFNVHSWLANGLANHLPTIAVPTMPTICQPYDNCGANQCQPAARPLCQPCQPSAYRHGWQLAGLKMPTMRERKGVEYSLPERARAARPI